MELKRIQIKKLLIQDLKLAQHILSKYSGGYSGRFSSAETFCETLSDAILRFENGDDSQIQDFWIWFAPTSNWDDFVGDANLGNRIFERLQELK